MVKQGCLTERDIQGKKLKINQQLKVIQLFKQLLKAGFTLTEIVAFLERSHLLKESSLSLMKASLMRGDRLDQMFASVGFSDNIVTQIALADKHGNLLGSLTKIETYMLRMTKVRKKLMEVATYPILLLGFLVLIMLGLKNYLLPQLLEGMVRRIGCTVGSNFSPALFCDFVRTSCIKLNSLSMGETPVSPCLLSTNGQNPFYRPNCQAIYDCLLC